MDERFDIMKEETTNIQNSAKSRKTASSDEVSSELLKLFDDDNIES
jgi:hypothetical protein